MLQIYNLKTNKQKISFAIKNLIVLFFCIAGQTAFSQSVTVTATNDVVDGTTTNIAALIAAPGADGKISLREAVMATNGEPSGATITITLPAATLVLNIAGTGETAGAPNAAIGDLDLLAPATGTKVVNINGAGPASTIISQTTGTDRIFDAHPNSTIAGGGNITLNISGVKMTGGVASAPVSGGAILAGRANDVTTLTNCLFDLNSAPANGGAISQSSSIVSHNLTITNCTFTNNSAGGAGGAVSYNGQGIVLITGSAFTSNMNTVAGGDGGAVSTTGGGSGGTYTVEKNTFLNNQTLNPTGHAGAVLNTNGTLTLRYNRFIGNTCANTSNPPLANIVGQTGGSTVNITIADNNWWGVNTGPGANDATALAAGGTMTITKWLQLKHTASPSSVNLVAPGNTTTLTASFLSNSANEAISVANLSTLIGLPIVFNNAVKGTISSPQATIQASGTATATFTADPSACPPPGSADAKVDNGIATATITIVDNIPPTISCPGNIPNVPTSLGHCYAPVSFTVTANDNCPGVTFTCTASGATTGLVVSGSNFNKGITTVTCQAKDAAGNLSTTCSFDISVVDVEAPVISGCSSNVTVQTGPGNLLCSQTATWTQPTAIDNCDGPVAYFSRSHVPGSVFPVGTTPVTYVFKDAAGNENDCIFNVIVQDNTPPAINNCPSTVTVQTGPGNTQCSQTATWTEPTATDNCNGALTFFSRSHIPGSTFAVGTTPVNYVFKDAAGNTSTCNFNVIVQDNTPPVVNGCPGTITVQTGPGRLTCDQTATWTEPTATDNCNGALTFFSRTSSPGSTFPVGTTSVTYTFKDGAGNTSTCIFNVVVQDNTTPAVNGCPGTITVQTGPGHATCDQTASWTEPTATDNCSGPLTFFSRTSSPGSTFPVGTTAVSYVFKDAAGNTSTCNFNVVIVDNTVPVVSGCPGTITVQTGPGRLTCDQTATWTEPTATDNCSGALTFFSRTSSPGSTFPVGTTPVTYIFKDAAGNTSTCNFNVVVQDNTPPVISCPNNIVVIESPAGSGSASVSFTVTATDNCPGAPTIVTKEGTTTITSPHTFAIGLHTIDATATDAIGNTSTCQFTITVNPACQITCPVVAPVSNDAGQCGAIVNYSAATTTGNCGTLNYSQASGTFFPIGTTMVTVSSPSTGQSCQFAVTVNDTEFPQITTCPGNQTVSTDPNLCTASVSFAAIASDNCPSGLTVKYYIGATEITSPHVFPKGTTTVTVKAKDAAGNETTCSFTVTVNDTQNPSVTAPADVTVYTGAGATTCSKVVTVAQFGNATHSDNCTGETVQITGVPAGNLFPVGTTVLTYTVTDGAGLQATSTQNIIVIDNTPPVVTCPGNQTFYTGPGRTSCDQVVTWPAPTTSDNCGTVTQIGGPATPSGTFPTGTTTVSYQFKDAAGNISGCSFTVTVIDNTPPAISGCPSNITVQTGPGNTTCTKTVTWTAPTAVDNCDGNIAPYYVSHSPGSTFNLGTTTVTYKFKDGLGNESICSFTVTVQDNTPPVINGCPTNQTITVSSSGCMATATWTQPTATDNCNGSVAYYFRSHAPGSSFPAGTTTVTYKFKDAAGNESICTFNITVVGTLVASIPDKYAYSPGAAVNTIYVGWTPASKITYTASVSGGQAPFSYKWTTSSAALSIQGSSTQSSVIVSSTVAGTYTLTLKVTDAYGCTSTANKTVKVVDSRCGAKLDKVALCKIQPAGTICINSSDVASQLANGNAVLGPCATNPVTRIESEPIKVTEVTAPAVTINPAKPGILNSESFKVLVSPNPSASDFTIRVQSNSNELINIRVTDALGRVITIITGVQKNSLVTLSKNYRGGNYFAEVTQGANHKTVKLVKLN